jgi:pyridoxamine 5'-phosphate oxidase
MRARRETRSELGLGEAPDDLIPQVPPVPVMGGVGAHRPRRSTRNLFRSNPIAVLRAWMDDATLGADGDANAMVLATATRDGAPSARVVLCKAIEESPPAAVFYTNYTSRKGCELDANPRAAAVFYWPRQGRQVRIEGAIVRTSAAESDAYFASRPLLSRLGAIASRQSRPLASRAHLAAGVLRAAVSAGPAPRRPEEWGGYRMLIDRVELWCAGRGRLHDRAVWVRPPDRPGAEWARIRLYP